MSSEMLIHVGVPKTATTLLQEQLFTDTRVFYPLGRFGSGGDKTVDADIRHLVWDGFHLDDLQWSKHAQRFKEAVQRHKVRAFELGKRPVISNEAITQAYLGRSSFDARFKRLQECAGENARILMFIRQQDSWMKSYYSSLVCNAGATLSYESFHEINMRFPLNQHFVMSSLDYFHVYSTARQYFEHVTVVPFEALSSPQGDGAMRLAKAVGVDGITLPERKVNQSRSAEHIGYARALNAKFPVHMGCADEVLPGLPRREGYVDVARRAEGGEKLSDFEQTILKRAQGERTQQTLTLGALKSLKTVCDLLRIEPLMDHLEPTDAQREDIRRAFSESNAQLEQAIGIDLQALGYRTAEKHPERKLQIGQAG